MVARLVAVGILTDESGNVRRGLRALDYGADSEQRVELFEHSFTASETVLKPWDVMRDEPGILPCVALAVVVGTVLRREWVERRAPSPSAVASSYESGGAIEIMPPRTAALPKPFRFRLFAESLCCKCGCPIGEGVFHVVGHGLAHQVTGDVAVLVPKLTSPSRLLGCLENCLKGPFPVEAGNFLDNRVGHDRYARISDHAVGLVAPQVPHRKPALLVAYREHGVYYVRHLFPVQERHQRHLGAVGVPKRECRAGHVGSLSMNLSVGAPVVPVHVAEERRRHHRVVEGGVEACLCIRRRLVPAVQPAVRNPDLSEFTVPVIIGGPDGSIEVPSGKLRLKIQHRALDAYRRKCDLEQDFLPL